MDNKQKLLDAFVRKATTYTIDVRVNSMLPASKIESKEIKLVIKPPTMHVLSLCASFLAGIPEDIYKNENIELKKAMQYQKEIAKVLCVLSFETEKYPEWMEEFIIKNVPSIDLLKIMQETALKCNPSFFLQSFQIAAVSNPMMLNDLTHTDS